MTLPPSLPKSVSVSTGFAAAAFGIYVAIALDIVAGAMESDTESFGVHVLCFGLQVVTLLGMVLMLQSLASETILIRRARHDVFLREFRNIIIGTPLYVVLFLVAKAYRLGQIYTHTPMMLIWASPGAQLLYWLQKLGGLSIYAIIILDVHRLLTDEMLYTSIAR